MVRCFSSCFFLACCSALAFAQTRKLNAPLAEGPAGTIGSFRLSPDGTRAVYLADERTDGLAELFVTPLDGSEPPLRLSGDEFPVRSFEIAPDGSRVVYLAEGESSQVQVYSVPIDGGSAPVRLNASLMANRQVVEARICSDSRLVVYRSDQQNFQKMELFSVPIEGGSAPKKLNQTLVGNGVSVFAISPDAATVVYEALASGNPARNLFAVPVDGGTPTSLTHYSGSSGAFYDTPSSLPIVPMQAGLAHVLYLYGVDAVETFDVDLYGVRIDGHLAPVQLTLAPMAPSDSDGFRYWPSLDGSRVLYADGTTHELYQVAVDGSSAAIRIGDASEEVRGDVVLTPDGTRALYRTQFGGTDCVRLFSVALNPPQSPVLLSNAGLNRQGVQSFQISPDGSSVVYVADPAIHPNLELYRAPVAGGISVKLSGTMQADGNVLADILLAPSGQVVFRADKEVDERVDVYSVPLDGSAAPTRLDGLLDAGRDVASFLAGSRVAFVADIEADEGFGLHSVPVDGSDLPIHISGSSLQVVGDVDAWRASPDGRFAVYGAAHARSGMIGLGRVDLLRSTPPAILDVGERFASLVVTPDSTRVVYGTLPLDLSTSGVYSVPADFSAAPVKLSGVPVGSGLSVLGFEVAPDSSRVTYVAHENLLGTNEVYSIAVNGLGGRVCLTPLASGRSVQSQRISPDSSRVVYVADQDASNRFELYSVPLAGGATVKLHTTLPANGDVASLFAQQPAFQISPDGQRVVFLADRDVDNMVELYSSAIDGSGAEVELNGALTPSGDVQGFRITPDSSRVVFVATSTGGLWELYSAPIAVGSAPVKLNAPLTSGLVDRADFLISSDSQYVIYRVDSSSAADEYFRVPVDGSASALRVTEPLGAGRSSSSGRISPDGAWFLFIADRDAAGEFGLFSVPFLGGTTRRLNLPLPSGGDVKEFSISPDSRRVAYRSDQVQDEVMELFTAPIGGGRPARRESGALAARGDVTGPFSFTPSGNALVYPADQEQDGVVELFLRDQGLLAQRPR